MEEDSDEDGQSLYTQSSPKRENVDAEPTKATADVEGGTTCDEDGQSLYTQPSPKGENVDCAEPTRAATAEVEGGTTTSSLESFFLADPISPKELEDVHPFIEEALENVVKRIEESGPELYLREQQEREAARKIQEAQEERALKDATVEGDPRAYQAALLEIAKQRNTIIHLGTGTGKTLIALLLIQHCASDFSNEKQTVFLTPSVALALQHTTSLQANLPYTVGTAFRRTVKTEAGRMELSKKHVVVATHGAFLDLLTHFGDFFQMDRINLLILDECHHCTGNSTYAKIMTQFYHACSSMHRPRVLGLTASPLINVKKHASDEALATQLHCLEDAMDAHIVSLADLGLDEEECCDAPSASLMGKEAEETTVFYHGTVVDMGASLVTPRKEGLDLQKTRIKELRQLDSLHDELGPYIVGIYCRALAEELAPNMFEQESTEQFRNALNHLQDVAKFCEDQCCGHPTLGRTDKLLALEELLEDQIEERSDAVGLVFVQRRITAIALNEYFRRRFISEQKGLEWPSANELRQAHKKHLSTTSQFAGEVSNHALTVNCLSRTSCTVTATTVEENGCMDVDGAVSDDEFDDRFMDADDDPFVESIRDDPFVESVHDDPFAESIHDDQNDQFEDADSLQDPSRAVLSATSSSPLQVTLVNKEQQKAIEHTVQSSKKQDTANDSKTTHHSKEPIRCGVLVRRPSSLFKTSGHIVSQKDGNESEKTLIQQEANIRQVLNGLRCGETNVLIATSVVEEGVDVQACSFVAAFDAITSTKSYIQMKGRARQENAKFFVFQNSLASESSLTLKDAQATERRIYNFFVNRELRASTAAAPERHSMDVSLDESLCSGSSSPELDAIEQGYYSAQHGTVSLKSAKSLLNRYAMAQPMEPAARLSRASLQAYMPEYNASVTQLCLPAHIASRPLLRVVSLPPQYSERSSKERQNILALMACVRLHRHNLLTDRLLPLTQESILSRIVALATDKVLNDSQVPLAASVGPETVNESTKVLVYMISQRSDKLLRCRQVLHGEHIELAVVTSAALGFVPAFKEQHPEFGVVSLSLAPGREIQCTSGEMEILTDFFTLIFNARWKRKTRDSVYCYGHDDSTRAPFILPYRVACVNANGDLQWDYMKRILSDSMRDEKERINAVRDLSDQEGLPSPRLWCPIYDPNVMYLSFGDSDLRCDAPFPYDTEDDDIRTYHDYYNLKRGFSVPPRDVLFDAQRLWHQPARYGGDEEFKKDLPPKKREFNYDGPYELCEGLVSLKLPKHACLESVLADAGLLLLCTYLPHVLYHIERFVTAKAFGEHCSRHLPALGGLISNLPWTDVITVLSARSCMTATSYERLEWLGDAVLKILQTDVIMKSTDLHEWIQNMHEGNLNSIRSVMGSNQRLAAACKRLGIDRFILTAPLARGQWTPSPMHLTTGSPSSEKAMLSDDGKMYADVIEALLGLAYLHGSYELAVAVGGELQVTIPWDEELKYGDDDGDDKVESSADLLSLIERFTRYRFPDRKGLVLEAFTHPTTLGTGTSSYQRLEWIGDAVLCLAARKWIFNHFPETEVGRMVLMEASMVSNETLAYLSLRNGLHTYLRHRDPSLPGRIESYTWDISERGRGLWGTDPPKAIADIVESLLGAIHVHGGLTCGLNAALEILQPVLLVFENSNVSLNTVLQHPKRTLLELGGKLISVSLSIEGNFVKEKPDAEVWLGERWGPVHREGHRAIASIECLGTTLISVTDHTPSSAANRASAFVLAALEKNQPLLERFKVVRGKIYSSTAAVEDTEDGNSESSGNAVLL